MADPERRRAVNVARVAGVVAFATTVAYVFTSGAGGSALYATPLLVVGGAIAVVLARRAHRAGLSVGDVVTTVLVTFALAFAVTLGAVLVIGFGACLIILGSASRGGTR